MAGYVRQKYPAQEALALALQETNSQWTGVKGHEVVGVLDSLTQNDSGMSQQGRKRGRSAAPSFRRSEALQASRSGGKGMRAIGAAKDQKRGKVKSKIGKIGTMNRAGLELCGAFNSKRGCPHDEGRCPQWGQNMCAVIAQDDGTVCGSKRHGATSHER